MKLIGHIEKVEEEEFEDEQKGEMEMGVEAAAKKDEAGDMETAGGG